MLTGLGKQKGLFFFGVVAFLVIAIVILIACLNNGRPSTGEEILASVPTVVGKSGWSYVIRSNATVANNISNLSYEPWDYAGLTASSVRAQFYSVGASNCSEAQYKDAVTQTLDQIDLMHRVFDKYEEYFIPASSAKDISTAGGSKRIAGFLAVDGGYALDSRMSVLRDYYRLGVRSVALGGRCSTPWSTSPIDNNPNTNVPANGFLNRTTFGEKIISEMNRLGMLIDLTGTTKETQMEAIRTSRAPVIFSSSASNNITEHVLNVDDDVLIELNARGGIIMVPFSSDQICTDVSNCTIVDIIAHIEHIWEVTNSKSVIGLGGNVGMIDVGNQSLEYPQGYSDSWGYVTLFNKLLENGNWTVNDLQDLAGNNFIRVLRSVEQIARDSTNQAPAEVAIDLNDIPLAEQGCYTDEGALVQSTGLRIARALENFHDSLYSFQGTANVISGSTEPGDTTPSTPTASTGSTEPGDTTPSTPTESTGSTEPGDTTPSTPTESTGSTEPGDTTPSTPTTNTTASTNTTTAPNTTTTVRTTIAADSTTPSGSSVTTRATYIVFFLQLLHSIA